MPRDYGVCRVCGNRIYGDEAVTDWRQAPKDAMFHWKSHVPKRDWPRWTYAAAEARKERQAVQAEAHAVTTLVIDRARVTTVDGTFDLEDRRAGLEESYEAMIAAFEAPKDVEFLPEVIDPEILARRAALDAEFEALANADLPMLDTMTPEEAAEAFTLTVDPEAIASLMPVSEDASAPASSVLADGSGLERSESSETGLTVLDAPPEVGEALPVKIACSGCGKLCAPGAGLSAHMRSHKGVTA